MEVMMNTYLQAKKVWDAMSAEARRNLLKQHGRDYLLSCRSYPYLPKEVRADIQPSLVKPASTNQTIQQKPVKHYWYQEI
jgi:hypothetical protein